MTLHQLKIFAAVARHLNITKASEEIRLSQPSASQQLKLLETECGTQLYRKAGRGIELTRDGKLFLLEAQAILAEVDGLRERFVSNGPKKSTASMTIGGSHATSAFFLPSVLAVYMQTHPHVAVALRSDTSRGIVRRVLSLELDIGAVTDAPEDPHLAIETLRQEKLVAFVSAKHPLAKTARMSLADLTKAPLVVKAEGSACAAFVRQTRERGLEPNIVMQCQSPMAVKVAVRKGAGVGLLYQEIVERDKGNGLKILKVPDLKITGWTSVVYHKERLLSAPVRDFLDLLRQWPKRQKLV